MALAPKFLDTLLPCNILPRRCPTSEREAQVRILLIRVGAFGDLLMASPLLDALRNAYPNAHITWVVEHSHVDAVLANPVLDQIIRWDGAYWTRMISKSHFHTWLFRALRFGLQLRKHRYDIFISLQPEEWPLLIKASGASTTIGVFDTFRRFYKDAATSRYSKLYRHAYTHTDLPDHRLEQYLLPLRALGVELPRSPQMHMGYTNDDKSDINAFLVKHELGGDNGFVVVCPMTTRENKCWPPERFTQLCDRIVEDLHLSVVLLGGSGDRGQLEAISSAMRGVPIVVTQYSLRQAAALIDAASLVVCGDTAPLHIASAMNTPYVGLFGATDPAWYAPNNRNGTILCHAVPCGPCDLHVCKNKDEDYIKCMKLIGVEQVFNAVTNLLALSPC